MTDSSNNSTVFRSQDEHDTIVRLHDKDMSIEVLSASIQDLKNVVSYRGDSNKHLQLCARSMNSFMRENYTGFIKNVGRNIYPMIIASDFEPGFEGVGSSFTLYLKDGSQHKIAPTHTSNYEIFKALSHTALAMFILLTPHLDNPRNIMWKGKITELRNHIEIFKDAVHGSTKEEALKEQLLKLANIYTDYINKILSDGTFDLEDFLGFTAEAFAIIRINMAEATLAQARAILPAMLKWKKLLGPEEWSKVYVMIPTVWPVALNSPRLQLFERLLDQDKIHTHIITSEYPRNFEEARDVVGRVVGDRTVGRYVFGTADTKAKMKVLALSSRTDVVADDFEINLQRAVDELDSEDRKLVHNGRVPNGGPIPSACPMHQVAPQKSQQLASAGCPYHQKKEKSLIIKQANIIGKEGLWDISCSAEGTISKIEAATQPAIVSSTIKSDDVVELDAAGRTILPGFVDAHIHLDKCYLLDRCCALKGDFPEALSETMNAKKNFTVSDIAARARKLIENEICFGTTLLRAHVEVDPIIGMKAVDAILPLKAEYAWAITIQIAVFAQEGITNQPGQVEMMRDALKRGCDVVGSAPYCDPNPEVNIDATFDLAKEFNIPVDFHLDYHLEGKPSYFQYVLDQTVKRGWQNRVCLGHMTYLSTFKQEEIEEIGKKLSASGVSVLALPASDICMMGRSDNGNRRRGVCPVNTLCDVGATAAFATNNVQNLFTFTGDGDVLKVGTLLCQTLQLTSEKNAQLCLEMATTRAAKAVCDDNHSIAEGMPADFVVLPGKTAIEILAAPPLERIVIKKGKIIARTSYAKQLIK